MGDIIFVVALQVATRSLTLTPWGGGNLHAPLLECGPLYTCFGPQAPLEMMLQGSQGYIRKACEVPPGSPRKVLPLLKCSLSEPKRHAVRHPNHLEGPHARAPVHRPNYNQTLSHSGFICTGPQIIPAQPSDYSQLKSQVSWGRGQPSLHAFLTRGT